MATVELEKVCVDIEKNLMDRFDEIYPQRGAKKWFFNEVLRSFIDIHDPSKVPTEIQQAVEQAISGLTKRGNE